ncbi:MAG: hypothetical protein F6K41_18205 [Symploca sp. SIO3E6]|nr:hypothetical protein [Caldora sp. SIO3E6]
MNMQIEIPVNPSWWRHVHPITAGEIRTDDVLVESYQGYDILLCVPNGGILCVSVVSPNQGAHTLVSDILDAYLYDDEDWHIEQAKMFVSYLEAGHSEQLGLELKL